MKVTWGQQRRNSFGAEYVALREGLRWTPLTRTPGSLKDGVLTSGSSLPHRSQPGTQAGAEVGLCGSLLGILWGLGPG